MRPHLAQVSCGKATGPRPDENECREPPQRLRQVRIIFRYAQQSCEPHRGAAVTQRGSSLAHLQLRQGQQRAGRRHRRGMQQTFGELVDGLGNRFDGRVTPRRNEASELVLSQRTKVGGKRRVRGHAANLRAGGP